MGEHEKVASFLCRGRKTCGFMWYSLPDLTHVQKRFIRISCLNVPEMRPLGTFQSILSNGYHGNKGSYKNFDFSFGYIFPGSMTV